MYPDNPPPHSPPSCPNTVLVVELDDLDADAVLAAARDEGATNTDADDDEIFWVVFETNPHVVRDFTERALYSSMKSWAAGR